MTPIWDWGLSDPAGRRSAGLLGPGVPVLGSLACTRERARSRAGFLRTRYKSKQLVLTRVSGRFSVRTSRRGIPVNSGVRGVPRNASEVFFLGARSEVDRPLHAFDPVVGSHEGPEVDHVVDVVGCCDLESITGLSERGSLSKVLGRFGKAKADSLGMSRYLAFVDEPKLAVALASCANWMQLREKSYREGVEPKVSVHAMHNCGRHLLCSVCAIRRGARLLRRYVEAFHREWTNDPSLEWFKVNFTVRNGPDLWERMRHLQRSLAKYQQRRNVARQHGEILKAAGGVSGFEVKRGSGSGLWHPHVHAIWGCHGEPDRWKLSDEWQSITGDSQNVFVERLYPDAKGSYVGGFAEVLKYAVKFSELSRPDRLHAFRELRRMRLVSSFGCFYGVAKEDEADGSPLTDADADYLVVMYRYLKGSGFVREAVLPVGAE